MGSSGTKIITSSDDVVFNQSSVDKAFGKHKQDFGQYPDGKTPSIKMFEQDVKNFIDNPSNSQKSGTWWGSEGTHIYDPETRLWVFINKDGTFNTGFKLSPEQYKNLIETGVVK